MWSRGATSRTASLSPDVNDPAKRNVTFDALRENYYEAAEALRNLTERDLAAETPLERWRPRFPCVIDLPGQFFVKHNATHLGQLSAWRRAGGRPPV